MIDKPIGIIYKATNTINGKSYIGQTITTLSKRRTDHKTRANTRRFTVSGIYPAIIKYGWDNFTWEILCNCYSKDELNEMEFHYIIQYDTYNNGYNLTFGGEGGASGYKLSNATKEKMSKLKEGMYLGRENPFYGKTHTDEFKARQSINCSKNYLITFPDGHKEIIKNLTTFCKKLNLDRRSMHRVISGKYKKHKGFRCEKVA
jgi:group I intron endonuclease